MDEENSGAEVKTYIDGRKRCEPYIRAGLYDRSTAATQIHKTVLALMHTDLTTPDDQSAVLYTGDMRGATGSTAD